MLWVSWAGKNTIISKLTQNFPGLLVQCLSYKTRDFRMDNGKMEKEWVDYCKTTTEEFEYWIKQGKYLEYNKYEDKKAPEGFSYYGTWKDEVMELLKSTHVIKELDVNGYKMLLEQTLDFPYFAFFLDTSDANIRIRIEQRETEDNENNRLILNKVINTRINTAQKERKIFNELMKNHPNHNIHFVDANQDVDGVYKDVTSIIKEYIPAMSL